MSMVTRCGYCDFHVGEATKKLRAENAVLAKMLRTLEWSIPPTEQRYSPECPVCRWTEDDGHDTSGCELEAILAQREDSDEDNSV